MGLLFILTSIGFWQLGKTGSAKAFIIPLLVAGGLLVVLGVGLIISNQLRISSFATAFSADSQAFPEMEIARAEKTINGYNSAVYKGYPAYHCGLCGASYGVPDAHLAGRHDFCDCHDGGDFTCRHKRKYQNAGL